MVAAVAAPEPILKPRDLVTTPTGRLAKILDILPGNERLVEFLEGERGEAVFRTSQLKIFQAAKVRLWKEHKL